MKKGKTRKRADFASKAILGTIAMMLISLLMVYFSAMLIPRGMMMHEDEWFTARIFASFANLLLIAYLFYVYLKDYMELRSKFTLGLLAFLFAFSFHAFISNPLVLFNLGIRFGAGGGGPFAFASMMFTGFALLVLAWISEQ
ncbi:hypothetical protein HY989_06400 [Candidatus Micrarchaeota archaeon]|nr:hypothetical protein [Candidatus Micrarchaeota archaeon]